MAGGGGRIESRTAIAQFDDQHALQRGLAARVDPSDVVQQSLLEAHRGFDRFAGESPGQWLAWLRGIATHNALDAARGGIPES